MATEKRLIDANALSEGVSGIGKAIKRPRAVELACLVMINEAPTVDAVVLPCKIGTQISLTEWHCSGMRWTKLIEPKPRNVHH